MPGQHPHRAGRAVSGGHDDSGITGSAWQSGSLSWRARASVFLATSALAGPLAGAAAHAETAAATVAGLSVSAVEVMQLAVFVGVTGAALLSAIVLIRERARTSTENVELRSRLADINAALRRSEALLNLRDQRVVVWAAENKKPELIGTLPVESGAPEDRAAFNEDWIKAGDPK